MKATATTTVDLTPAQIWPVLVDMSTWAPWLKANLVKEGVDDRHGVGAVRSIDLPGPGPAIVEEIVEFEPETRLVYRALSGIPFRGYGGEVELRPSGAGTEIRYTLTADERVPVAEQLALRGVAQMMLTLLARAAKR